MFLDQRAMEALLLAEQEERSARMGVESCRRDFEAAEALFTGVMDRLLLMAHLQPFNWDACQSSDEAGRFMNILAESHFQNAPDKASEKREWEGGLEEMRRMWPPLKARKASLLEAQHRHEASLVELRGRAPACLPSLQLLARFPGTLGAKASELCNALEALPRPHAPVSAAAAAAVTILRLLSSSQDPAENCFTNYTFHA